MDKFFYTGSIETVANTETQDNTGIGRLGIDVKTDVEAWEHETTKWSLRRGKYVEKPCIKYYSKDLVATLRKKGVFDEKNMVCKTVNAWVSDHFGIAVSIKVL